jgi:hypothetical protein
MAFRCLPAHRDSCALGSDVHERERRSACQGSMDPGFQRSVRKQGPVVECRISVMDPNSDPGDAGGPGDASCRSGRFDANQ